ncbi:predicted protein [Phaeodactylum tricornutum CCAP 1055/1]|jgi:hypothetical protein|uniref:CRAL-TRIO domain-containing protein n=2 Tax=Phaeodactylum tricornutum TaxID=2850 RepID=B7FU39_PHATC|nr:predicted protein [Phaeodactylum tricornutum CCAP 1055/1]EEC50197.1 predicted protein [Phaeodactylum tricornutum CCAP 1055/1]|eukprot:XP_002178532.1 predicted protein [Phaeodactylum tricornutum CCAP 1055/1]
MIGTGQLKAAAAVALLVLNTSLCFSSQQMLGQAQRRVTKDATAAARVEAELHCDTSQRRIQKEEPRALLTKSLYKFEQEVEALSEERKKYLRQAETTCPEMLHDDFKLMFLRTEQFNVELAARRYATYWEHRVELFGPEKAFLPLTLSGAMKDDLKSLSHGYTRTVSGHGRVLLMDPSRIGSDYDIDSIARCQWYVLSKALEHNIDMQRLGAVFVLDLGTIRTFDRKLLKRLSETGNDGFPVRCDLYCIVNPPPLVDFFVNVIKVFLKPEVRKSLYVVKTGDSLAEYVSGLTLNGLYDSLDHDKWVNDMLLSEK